VLSDLLNQPRILLAMHIHSVHDNIDNVLAESYLSQVAHWYCTQSLTHEDIIPQ